jgi:putative CocE/NonD family hydrolase
MNRFLALTVILSIVIMMVACSGGEDAIPPPVPTLAASLTPTSKPIPPETTAPIATAAGAQEQKEEPVSEFGLYEGYSEPLYDGYTRTSQYLEVRDGTLLAVDIYRPMLNDQIIEEPLPVIWTHTRYQRARRLPDGDVEPGLGGARNLIPYGYVISVVDARGSGASFGIRTFEFTPEEAQDAYDITEWLAAQPWCDGNVGMSGGSYLGITQLFAAAQAPPSLKAIFPAMHVFDIYDEFLANGIFMRDFLEEWDASVRNMDYSTPVPVAPVDEDPDGVMLAEALALRPQNIYPLELTENAPYRNSPIPGVGTYDVISPRTYTTDINTAGVAIYQLGGWYDIYTTDPMLWFVNLEGPHKLVMTGWYHSYSESWLNLEQLRWFDYWLKGIDNGIMDEPPLRYYVMGAPDDEAWRTADEWPLPNEERVAFYFQAGLSESVSSVNDGLLIAEAPIEGYGQDDYTVDYSTTTGKTNRFANGYGAAFRYPNMVDNDRQALTYSTPPLDGDIEITGHPVVHLWVTSTADDGDFSSTWRK